MVVPLLFSSVHIVGVAWWEAHKGELCKRKARENGKGDQLAWGTHSILGLFCLI